MRKEVLRLENMDAVLENGMRITNFYFNLFEGEVIALTGFANSALDSVGDILCGRGSLHNGEIFLSEEPVEFKKGRPETGIYEICEQSRVMDSLTVIENYTLLYYSQRGSFEPIIRRKREIEKSIREMLAEMDIEILADRIGKKLSLAESHLVELAMAAACNAKIVIMKDCFGDYAEKDFGVLKRNMRKLQGRGISFILPVVSLQTYERFCDLYDRVMVFKKNKVIKVLTGLEVQVEGLLEYLTGQTQKGVRHSKSTADSRIIYRTEGLCSLYGLKEECEISSGEIITLQVYMEDRDGIAKAMAGLMKIKGLNCYLYDKRLRKSASGWLNKKIAYVNSPGNGEDVLDNLTVAENILVPSIKKIMGLPGYIDRNVFKVLKEDLNDPLNLEVMAGELSRTEKIKVIIQRWLLFRPTVLIMQEPFLFADTQETMMLSDFIYKLAEEGSAVIIIHSGENYMEI